MAESQVPYPYDRAAIDALTASFSPERFQTYLDKSKGNEAFAIALYLYNAKLAKSFLFPLSITEITFRNAVDMALVKEFGDAWHQSDEFRIGFLNEKSRASLDKALSRTRGRSKGKVIAELTFDFWSNLFRPEYGSLWRTKANIAFPNLKHGEGRHTIQNLVRVINDLRNRVAHHEPILDMNVPDMQAKMITLVALRCQVTSDWMRQHSTVSSVMRSRPTVNGATQILLGSRVDSNFLEVTEDTSIMEIASRNSPNYSAFICLKDGQVVGAFTNQHVGRYIAKIAVENATLQGLMDLNDHTVIDILNHTDAGSTWQLLPSDSPWFDAVRILKGPKVQTLVGIDPASQKPVGVMLRAHRRY